MFFYKVYRYCNKATAVSGFSSGAALILVMLAFFSWSQIGNIAARIALTVLCAAAAIFFFVYMSRILPDKIAEKDFAVKIKTSASVALLYCKDHPEHFDAVAAENPAFAAKYCKDEKGKIVKIKNVIQ